MKSNLDVWAIQYYPEQLLTALSKIQDGMNIIYSNCICFFKVGDEIITNRQFDTILYNEESDILILLMRDGKATKLDIIKYLEENNKKYVEITFDASALEEYQNDDSIPEIWFAREEYVLDDALKDSKNKNVNECTIYPNINSSINFGYNANDDNNYFIDGRIFKSLIKLNDKLIFIINQLDNVDQNGICRNLTENDIFELLNKYGFEYEESYDKPNPHFDKTRKK